MTIFPTMPPCPSCASPLAQASVRYHGWPRTGRDYRVGCPQCGMTTTWMTTQTRAIEAWCRRDGENLLVAALRSVRAWQRDAIMAWATAPNSEVRQDRWRECQVARATLERLMDGAV